MSAGKQKKVFHGGTGKLRQEKTGKTILDFSASVNPYPPEISWKPDEAGIERYPDDTYWHLKETIAATFHRGTDEICVGNGSIELIRTCCAILLSPCSSYYTEDPTFGEYAYSARLVGAKRIRRMRGADLVFICNPNNPDGRLRSRDEMRGFLSTVAGSGGILCADEAFIELADPVQSLTGEKHGNLLVLRSLTKCFAVPGLRFGYGFGPPDLIDRMEATRLPWTVNAYAEAFALEAFRHFGELESSRQKIARERAILSDGITRLGMSCSPSAANYLLVETGGTVAPLCRNLEDQGVLVRDCTSFGLPTKIRIAIRTEEENRQLLEVLPECLP